MIFEVRMCESVVLSILEYKRGCVKLYNQLLLHRRKKSDKMAAQILRMTSEELDKIVDDRVT